MALIHIADLEADFAVERWARTRGLFQAICWLEDADERLKACVVSRVCRQGPLSQEHIPDPRFVSICSLTFFQVSTRFEVALMFGKILPIKHMALSLRFALLK
jgi:hypothetical protein